MNEELPIIQKTFDMILWLIPKIDKFPRKQQFILGERIEAKALDFIGLLQKAKYISKKRNVLLEAHATFEQSHLIPIRLAIVAYKASLALVIFYSWLNAAQRSCVFSVKEVGGKGSRQRESRLEAIYGTH